MNTPVDRRNFYLMLSVPQGQGIANLAGFHPPSEDVIEKEAEEIIKRWLILGQVGALDSCIEASEWFFEIFSKNLVALGVTTEAEMEVNRQNILSSVASFGVALTYKMLTEDIIHLGGHV